MGHSVIRERDELREKLAEAERAGRELIRECCGLRERAEAAETRVRQLEQQLKVTVGLG